MKVELPKRSIKQPRKQVAKVAPEGRLPAPVQLWAPSGAMFAIETREEYDTLIRLGWVECDDAE